MAAEVRASLLDLFPGFTIAVMTNLLWLWNFKGPVKARMAKGLREVGLPEGAG
jgi:hypothetical protein